MASFFCFDLTSFTRIPTTAAIFIQGQVFFVFFITGQPFSSISIHNGILKWITVTLFGYLQFFAAHFKDFNFKTEMRLLHTVRIFSFEIHHAGTKLYLQINR